MEALGLNPVSIFWHALNFLILLFVLIDPQLSVMTDDVVAGATSEPVFRRTIVLLSLSRIGGTILAQLLFLPAAWLVVVVAGII